MIGRTNVGGGLGTGKAAIAVEYPVESTCVCSNGSRTLKSKGTNGKWLFTLPSAEDWTVSITDGNKTMSKTVSAELYGAYELQLFYAWLNDGKWGIEHIEKKHFSDSTITIDDGKILLTSGNANGSAIYLGVYADLTEMSEVYADCSAFTYDDTWADEMWYHASAGIFITDTADPNWLALWDGTGTALNSRTVERGGRRFSLNVSSITGWKYVWFGQYAPINTHPHSEWTLFNAR